MARTLSREQKFTERPRWHGSLRALPRMTRFHPLNEKERREVGRSVALTPGHAKKVWANTTFPNTVLEGIQARLVFVVAIDV